MVVLGGLTVLMSEVPLFILIPKPEAREPNPQKALRGGISRSFLEPLGRSWSHCGHLWPTIDKVSEELTLRYPHEGPCVARTPGVDKSGGALPEPQIL